MKFEIAKRDKLARYTKSFRHFEGKTGRITLYGQPMSRKDINEFRRRGYTIEASEYNGQPMWWDANNRKRYSYKIGW